MGLFTWIFQRPPCWEYEWVFAVVISYPRHKGFSKASPLGNDVVIPVSGLQPRVAVLQREPAAPAAQWWYLEVAENTSSLHQRPGFFIPLSARIGWQLRWHASWARATYLFNGSEASPTKHCQSPQEPDLICSGIKPLLWHLQCCVKWHAVDAFYNVHLSGIGFYNLLQSLQLQSSYFNNPS